MPKTILSIDVCHANGVITVDKMLNIGTKLRLVAGGIKTFIKSILEDPEVTSIANCSMVVLLSAGEGITSMNCKSL